MRTQLTRQNLNWMQRVTRKHKHTHKKHRGTFLPSFGLNDLCNTPRTTAESRLKGIAHDLAHHSVSTLSWLLPHLSQDCRKNGISKVTLDLIAIQTYPDNFKIGRPLEVATNCLKECLSKILEEMGLSEDVHSVTLEFSFPSQRKNDYTCSCRVRLMTVIGKEYAHSQCKSQSFGERVGDFVRRKAQYRGSQTMHHPGRSRYNQTVVSQRMSELYG